MAAFRVAVIAGDGIGVEVIDQAVRVTDAALRHEPGARIEWTNLPWSCAYYRQHGRMMPDDAWETLARHHAILFGAIGSPDVPDQIPHANRRWVVSCYSWPGVHPHACMELYGDQLEPLLRTLFHRGGVAGLRPKGEFHERALWRASLRTWLELHPDVEHAGPEMHGLRRD